MNVELLEIIKVREPSNTQLHDFISIHEFMLKRNVDVSLIRRTVGPEPNIHIYETTSKLEERVAGAIRELQFKNLIHDPLLVVMQSDGNHYLLDSNHLFEAAVRLGKSKFDLLCTVGNIF